MGARDILEEDQGCQGYSRGRLRGQGVYLTKIKSVRVIL